jgi:3-hydroxybutyryl-CoA dehydratase
MRKISDFRIGEYASYEKTILGHDVKEFAEISGNFNPLHLDEDAAKRSIFKKRVVHGALVSSLFSTVLGTSLPGEGTIYLEQFSKYVKPVYLGDHIKATVKVSEVDIERNKMKLDTIALNQNNEVVVKGYAWVMLM